MAVPNRHIIHRQVLGLQIGSKEDGYRLQEEVSRMFWRKVLPRMERLFDKFSSPEQLVRIDKLELDLGVFPREGFEEAFLSRLMEQLELQLQRKVWGAAVPGVEKLDLARSQFSHWLNYLASGILPWEATRIPEVALQQQVLAVLASQATAVNQLINQLRRSERALQRLILQHEERFLNRVLDILTVRKNTEWLSLAEELSGLWSQPEDWIKMPLTGRKRSTSSSLVKMILWRHLFAWVITRRNYPELLTIVRQFSRQMIPLFIEKDALDPLLETRLRQFITTNSAEYPILYRLVEKYPQKGAILGKMAVADEGITPDEREIEKRSKNREISEENADASQRPVIDEAVREDTGPESSEIDFTGKKEQKVDSPPKEDALEPTDEKLDLQEDDRLKIRKSFSDETDDPDAADPYATERELVDEERELPGIEDAVPEGEDVKIDEDFASIAIRSFADTPEGNFFTIHHAGLVLLHPYLPILFGALDLLEKKDFRDETARHRAIHLLHWLATGREDAPEYELLFPRFLCNLPFEIPIERSLVWEPWELEEADKMLQAVISNWTALKNTSPDGLRDGFLQREGRLEKRPDGWVLTIEGKTMDILLNRLPWGINIIKLPWMDEILRVDWI
jgi:hypothetical protein